MIYQPASSPPLLILLFLIYWRVATNVKVHYHGGLCVLLLLLHCLAHQPQAHLIAFLMLNVIEIHGDRIKIRILRSKCIEHIELN